MSLHAYGPQSHVPTASSTGVPSSPVVTDRMGMTESRSFAVRVRFATPAARASGFEVVVAESQVGGVGATGRLGSVVETASLDLLILVGGAPDPDAALGVATEALRESLLGFQVMMVGPADGALHRAA